MVPTGGSETALDTPSGQQSGLKMNVNLTVEPDKVADFVLDFDACKSVGHARGNSGRYNLKPVIAVIPVLSDASASASSATSIRPIARREHAVSLQQNGVRGQGHAADDERRVGKFVLLPGAGRHLRPRRQRRRPRHRGDDGRAGDDQRELTFANPASAPHQPAASTHAAASGDGRRSTAQRRSTSMSPPRRRSTAARRRSRSRRSRVEPAAASFPVLAAGERAAARCLCRRRDRAELRTDGERGGQVRVTATPDGLAAKSGTVDLGAADFTATFTFP